jgi:hypothetical protein
MLAFYVLMNNLTVSREVKKEYNYETYDIGRKGVHTFSMRIYGGSAGMHKKRFRDQRRRCA